MLAYLCVLLRYATNLVNHQFKSGFEDTKVFLSYILFIESESDLKPQQTITKENEDESFDCMAIYKKKTWKNDISYNWMQPVIKVS